MPAGPMHRCVWTWQSAWQGWCQTTMAVQAVLVPLCTSACDLLASPCAGISPSNSRRSCSACNDETVEIHLSSATSPVRPRKKCTDQGSGQTVCRYLALSSPDCQPIQPCLLARARGGASATHGERGPACALVLVLRATRILPARKGSETDCKRFSMCISSPALAATSLPTYVGKAETANADKQAARML